MPRLINVIHFIFVLGSFAGASIVTAVEVKVGAVVLLNPVQEFGQRAPGTKTMSGYIKAIERAMLARLGPDELSDAESGFVTVAILPNRKMKLWIDIDGVSRNEAALDVQTKMADEGVPIVAGPIAFLLTFSVSDESDPDSESPPQETTQSNPNPPPIPSAWKKAIAKAGGRQLKIPDDVLPLVWPQEVMASGSAFSENTERAFIPDGYVIQSLDPLGGSLARPKDWHYSEGHGEHHFMWTISKESPEDGYETGLRIQLFPGIKKRTKQTAQAFIQSFLRSKQSSVKVLSRRDPIVLGSFIRAGLETEEPRADETEPAYRILYSCFWANDLDIAAITISGTPIDQWEEHQEAFDVMGSMVLIAPDKIEKESP